MALHPFSASRRRRSQESEHTLTVGASSLARASLATADDLDTSLRRLTFALKAWFAVIVFTAVGIQTVILLLVLMRHV